MVEYILRHRLTGSARRRNRRRATTHPGGIWTGHPHGSRSQDKYCSGGGGNQALKRTPLPACRAQEEVPSARAHPGGVVPGTASRRGFDKFTCGSVLRTQARQRMPFPAHGRGDREGGCVRASDVRVSIQNAVPYQHMYRHRSSTQAAQVSGSGPSRRIRGEFEQGTRSGHPSL